MAGPSRIIYFGAALLALPCVLATPVSHQAPCQRFDVQSPPGFLEPFQFQWCQMVNGEISSTEIKEDPTVMIPNLEALYKQANIKADPRSALPNMDELTQDSSVIAAYTQMKANFPRTGSMDLTAEQIKSVYADHIGAACEKTGVPEFIIVQMISEESKGHPFVYHSLTQHDYISWGQMADKNGDLNNRYMPADNIMAGAMRLKDGRDGCGYDCDWATALKCHYQHC